MTVSPIIDYEPPAHPGGYRVPGRPARRPRPPRRTAALRPAPVPAAAAAFADAALRRVLEVLDARRPVRHLGPLLAAGLVEAVRAAPPPAAAQPAVLQRLRVQPVHTGGEPRAVEVFGTYRRGVRVHALAGRVERTGPGGAAGADPGWRLVALQIG